MKFGACIDTLYTELPFYNRFAAAKADGFDAVEFWDWRVHDLDKVAACAKSAGILISGFNGDADYSLVDPDHYCHWYQLTGYSPRSSFLVVTM